MHSADGRLLASGEMIQTVEGDRVDSETTLYFRDGSVYEENAVFSQDRRFRLLSDHVRQSGPSFPDAFDRRIDTATGSVTTQSIKDGAKKPDVRQMKLPEDLANGLLVTLMKNLSPDDQVKVPMLAGSTKPRVVELTIRSEGRKDFSLEGRMISATHYVVHTTIGGVTGAMASLLGKQPPDAHFWIRGGKAPTFIRASTPLYDEGPVWTIELAPVRSADDRSRSQESPAESSASRAGNPQP